MGAAGEREGVGIHYQPCIIKIAPCHLRDSLNLRRRRRTAREAARAREVLGTNWRPAARPRRLLRLVAAYWAAVSMAMAAAGKYRSPEARGPWVDGFPDLVRHRSSVHRCRLDWRGVRAPLYPPPARLYCKANIWALRADHCPAAPPLSPDMMRAFSRSRNRGSVYTPDILLI